MKDMAGIEALGKPGHCFTNWAETFSCRPELYFEPDDVEQLKEILSLARAKSKKVKVVGHGHSPSNLACTTDYMITLKHFNKVLKIDPETCLVTVEAGITLKTLNERLHANNLALCVQGSISNLSLAGVVSTGTHGTGIRYGIISSYVQEMQLLTASGDILTLTRSNNESVFLAALVGLGSLGIILTITIQCEPAYRLKQNQYTAKLQDVLENLDVHLKASDHFRFMYYPYTEECVAFHMSRTEKPVKATSSWFWDRLVGYHFLECIYWISTHIPSIVPSVNHFQLWLNSASQERIDWSPRIFNFDCLFKQYVIEYAIPRENAALALLELNAWIANHEGKVPVHSPVEVRFVKADDVYLSPSYGRDTCYINPVMFKPYGKTVPHHEYWKAFEDIMLRVGGRPHWAKEHGLTADNFKAMYPKWEEFCTIRRQLDPAGMFMNENLQNVFSHSKL